MKHSPRFDIRDHLGDPVRREGATHRFPCPSCGSRDNLAVTPTDDGGSKFHCFSECSTDEIWDCLGVAKGTGEQVEHRQAPRPKSSKAPSKPKHGEFTEAQARADISQSRDNARRRGFTDETIDTFGLEWLESYGHPKLSISYRHHSTGEVVKRTRFVKPEAPNERGEKTFSRQFHWPKGTTAAELIFGSDIRDADEFILASGETDAMAWVQATGVPTIAIPGEGLKLSGALLDLFRGRRVYVAMDNDSSGVKSSRARCKALVGVAREVLEVKIPEESGCKDAADLLRAERGAELVGLLERAQAVHRVPSSDFPDFDERQWDLDESGLYRVHPRTGRNQITARPIFPVAIGVDLMDSNTRYTKLRRGGRESWHRDSSLRSREYLISLGTSHGRSVTHENWKAIDSWIQHTTGCLEDAHEEGRIEMVGMASKAGWLELDGRQRFIAPGDERIQFVGTHSIEVRGSVEQWLEGVYLLTGLGTGGLISLKMVLGALGSPMSHFLARNPIFSVVAKTSTGKGSVAEFAASIWRPSRGKDSCVRAKGTWRGYQDAGFGPLNNYPMIIDEFWKLETATQKSIIEDMSDGQRRALALAKQDGQVDTIGGEKRAGVTILLGEQDVMNGMPAGSTARVITFDAQGALFPKNPENEKKVKSLTTIARKNAGVVGAKFISWLNEQDINTEVERLHEMGRDFMRRVPGTAGELTGYAGLVMWTAQAFRRAFRVELPEKELFESLVVDLEKCKHVADLERQVAEHLVNRIVTRLGDGNQFEEFGELIARKSGDAIEVNPEARWTIETIRQVAPDIKPDRLAKELANQGITEKSTEKREGRTIERYKVKSRHFGKWVWRFNPSFIEEVTGDSNQETVEDFEYLHHEDDRPSNTPDSVPYVADENQLEDQKRVMSEIMSFTPSQVPDEYIYCPGVPGPIHLRTWIPRQVQNHKAGEKVNIDMARHALRHIKTKNTGEAS